MRISSWSPQFARSEAGESADSQDRSAVHGYCNGESLPEDGTAKPAHLPLFLLNVVVRSMVTSAGFKKNNPLSALIGNMGNMKDQRNSLRF